MYACTYTQCTRAQKNYGGPPYGGEPATTRFPKQASNRRQPHPTIIKRYEQHSYLKIGQLYISMYRGNVGELATTGRKLLVGLQTEQPLNIMSSGVNDDSWRHILDNTHLPDDLVDVPQVIPLQWSARWGEEWGICLDHQPIQIEGGHRLS